MSLPRFKTTLSPLAVHIDYLRLRCGKEGEFLEQIDKLLKKREVAPFIAFAEWDVVLFIPSKRLYSDQLLATYTNPTITTAVAGSSGYYNYVWDHDINQRWKERLFNLASEKPKNAADVLMLVSLRFTDIFRCRYGLGSELLFCNYLNRLQERHKDLELFAVQSVGWNDMTIILHTSPGKEAVLLQALTDIRYCTYEDLLPYGNDQERVVAATYSHVLGNLKAYVGKTLSFGGISDFVRKADLLVRVTPAMEPSIRNAYETVVGDLNRECGTQHDPKKDLGTELGHYNFSADIKWAFELGNAAPANAAPVKVIQGLRQQILSRLKGMGRNSSSFPETTTVITFEEETPPTFAVLSKSTVPLIERYDDLINELLQRVPGFLTERAGRMTRHRLAVFLGSISAHLADPVRGSIVSHICRFLAATFETVIERMDRNEKEDLCQVLEYALNQATDGLSQFQHDANSLGLSGRGGYARVIHAIEQWTLDLIEGLGMNFMPLVTFGMQSTRDTMAVKHRIDMPFSTAFAPAWWPTLLHEIGHLCWYEIFGWRLDSIEVWKAFNEGATVPAGSDEEPREYLSARAIAKEVFPNYMILHVVAGGAGKLKRLDELMLKYELRVVPAQSVSRTLRLRTVIHALLALHDSRRTPTSADILKDLSRSEEGVPVGSGLAVRLDQLATSWWQVWTTLDETGELLQLIRTYVDDATEHLGEVIADSGFDREWSARSNVTLKIPGTDLFKEESVKAVRSTIGLMAALARDQEGRRGGDADRADASYASFGEVLARIDRIQHTVQIVRTTSKDEIDSSFRRGEVFAQVAPATILASLLSDIDPDQRREMPLNLAIILSLWHRNITASMLEESQKYHDELVRLKIITDV